MTLSRLIPFSILQLPSLDAIRRLRRPGAVQRLIMAAVVAAGLVRADTAERPHPPIPVLNREARSDWKSVKDAGAVGDGVADDTAATQSVLDAAREHDDGVSVFGRYQKQPFRKGLHLSGLGGNDQVVMNSVQGNLHLAGLPDLP